MKDKCYFCGKEFEYKFFSKGEIICPFCGRNNGISAIEQYEEEIKKRKKKEEKEAQLKKLFNTEQDVNLSFKYICDIEGADSYLAYNCFTKIVYIRQRYYQNYHHDKLETNCPFISPNGKYYRYLEETGVIEEV